MITNDFWLKTVGNNTSWYTNASRCGVVAQPNSIFTDLILLF